MKAGSALIAVVLSAIVFAFPAGAASDVDHFTIGPTSASLTDCLGVYGNPFVLVNMVFDGTVVHHINPDGTGFIQVSESFTAVGESDGIAYHGGDTVHDATRTDANGTTFFDHVLNSRVIGHGAATNYLIHQQFRASLTADGTFTIDKESFKTTCSA